MDEVEEVEEVDVLGVSEGDGFECPADTAPEIVLSDIRGVTPLVIKATINERSSVKEFVSECAVVKNVRDGEERVHVGVTVSDVPARDIIVFVEGERELESRDHRGGLSPGRV